MAKKFMYVCFGILALAAVFHLGAQYGAASIVDHGSTGIVAVSGSGQMLLDNGEVWFFHDGGPSWEHRSQYDLPVPISQVKFWWGEREFATVQNDVWYWDDSSLDWVNFGTPPGYASARSTTWGQIKAEFGE